MAIPKEYLDIDYDFGFTTDEELVAKIEVEDALSTVDVYKKKLQEVEKLIIPLLVNLMKNPQVDTIKWPGRAPIIEKQIEKILAITRSII
jgi:hypothetical protein